MELIGRNKEIKELENLYRSDSPEFVAVYGRRRVGKTFLIKELFRDRLTFWHTGLSPFDRDKTHLLRDQLLAFFYSLQDYGLHGCQCSKHEHACQHILKLESAEPVTVPTYDNGDQYPC